MILTLILLFYRLTNFGCTIETTDEILGRLALGRISSRAEIAQLEHQFALVHQDIVGLDVGMQDLAFLEQPQGTKQLTGVGAHGRDVQAHVLAVFLEHLA